MSEITYEDLLESYSNYLEEYAIRYATTNVVLVQPNAVEVGIPTQTPSNNQTTSRQNTGNNRRGTSGGY